MEAVDAVMHHGAQPPARRSRDTAHHGDIVISVAAAHESSMLLRTRAMLHTSLPTQPNTSPPHPNMLRDEGCAAWAGLNVSQMSRALLCMLGITAMDLAQVSIRLRS